jgi:hypothetical protein
VSEDRNRLSSSARSKLFFDAIKNTQDPHVMALALRGIRVPKQGLVDLSSKFIETSAMTSVQLTAAAEAAERTLREPGAGDLAPHQAALGLRAYRDAKFGKSK